MDLIFNMRDAKTSLSKLVVLAEAGETVILARDGKPVVKLVLVQPRGVPVFGLGKGKMPPLGMESFAPMTDEDAAEWGIE
jgi:antitoxin (DNA-binding transcriptional repressor) of toxin-antitoxin stability system